MTMLTVRDVADMLSLSPQTVARLTRRGELPVVKMGKSIRYREADVLAYVASRLTPTTGGATHAE